MSAPFAEMFRLPSVETFVQLGLAIGLGACIGIEREIRGRAAGLRTMIIVCLGATVIMIVSAQLASPFQAADRDIIRVDPGRVAAGIVTGIGFIGAGVILKLGDLVRGVTTAACIWFVAGLGIAIGQRHYGLAITATAACVAVLWLLQYFDRMLPSRIYRTITIVSGVSAADSVGTGANQALAATEARIMDLKVIYDRQSDVAEFTIAVRVLQRFDAQALVSRIAKLDGVSRVDWS